MAALDPRKAFAHAALAQGKDAFRRGLYQGTCLVTLAGMAYGLKAYPNYDLVSFLIGDLIFGGMCAVPGVALGLGLGKLKENAVLKPAAQRLNPLAVQQSNEAFRFRLCMTSGIGAFMITLPVVISNYQQSLSEIFLKAATATVGGGVLGAAYGFVKGQWKQCAFMKETLQTVINSPSP